MRIAFLTHQWPGARMGGIGAAVRQTALALAQAGHDVHVFTFTLPQDVREKLPPGIRVHEVADLAQRVQRKQIRSELAAMTQVGGDGVYRLALGWLLCEELLRVHAEQRFDVVETPEVEALGLPLMLDGALDAPVLVQLHCCTSIARIANHLGEIRDSEAPAEPGSTGAETGVQAGKPAPQKLPRGGDDTLPVLEFATMQLADAASAPTRAVVKATKLCCPLPQDVRIIPHPFVADGEYTNPPGDGPILFVGRLERLKGVETIVAALNEFLPRHPTCIFRFIGPDTNTAPHRRAMRQWLESNLDPAVRNRVQFLGEISGEQIAREWMRASFGVMPSLWENFSMAACEAMAAGRTLIVADGTGSAELVGEAGIVVERGSAQALCAAIESLWTERQTLERLSKAAFERMRSEFSPKRVAQRRDQYYRDAISNLAARARPDFARRLESVPATCLWPILPALIRLTGALTGADISRATPGSRLLRLMDDIEKRSGAPAEVVLYGAGKYTARLLSERHRWEARRHRVVGIIDDHPRFAQTPVYLDLPVQSLESVQAQVRAGKTIPPVVLSTDTYEEQFWARCGALRERGVQVLRLYSRGNCDV
jgi:glycosyltransferase involved in cell wall biosynthesis